MKSKFLAAVTVLLAISCSPRIVEHIRTETRIEYRDSISYRDTTIYVPVPIESSGNHLQPGDTSKLETSLAESEAWVDSTGLRHTLRNKPGKFGIQLSVPSRTITSFAVNNKAEIIEKKVYVEKPLTAWQKFRLKAFWHLVLLSTALALWVFRKPVLKLLKLLKVFGV